MDIYQILGFFGMLFVVVAYLLLQMGRMDNKSLKYQFLNLIGAVLLLISLFVHFNLGSFVIEVFWIAITLYGIYNILKNSKDNNEKI